MDVQHLNAMELLSLHSNVEEELRSRGVTRSANNPTGDLAEYLCCKAFGLTPTCNSNPATDAVGEDGTLYQIKGRRMARPNTSRQLGALRGLDNGDFHALAAVLFDRDYSVARAAIIPHRLVLENSRFQAHTNSWRFMLRDVVWSWPGVEDATERLRAVEI